jgi:hypothetical protein
VEVEALQKGYKRDAPGWASGRVDEQKIEWQLFLVRFSYVELGLGRGAPLLPFCLFLRPFPGANTNGGSDIIDDVRRDLAQTRWTCCN